MPKMMQAETIAAERQLATEFEAARESARDALSLAGIQLEDLPTWEDSSRLTSELAGRNDNAALEAQHKLEELSRLRDRYLESTQHVISFLVSSYSGCGIDKDDLYQEASLGLLRAMDRYDHRRGVRFSTYAQYWIKERVLSTLYDQSKTIRLPAWVQKMWGKVHKLSSENGEMPDVAALSRELGVSEKRIRNVLESRRTQTMQSAGADTDQRIEETFGDERYRPEALVDERSEVQEVLSAALEALSDRESEVLKRRFGLLGHGKEALSTIAKDLGLTAERIRQIQIGALERLKNHSRLAQFSECLA